MWPDFPPPLSLPLISLCAPKEPCLERCSHTFPSCQPCPIPDFHAKMAACTKHFLQVCMFKHGTSGWEPGKFISQPLIELDLGLKPFRKTLCLGFELQSS